jgi:hypothetical protein
MIGAKMSEQGVSPGVAARSAGSSHSLPTIIVHHLPPVTVSFDMAARRRRDTVVSTSSLACSAPADDVELSEPAITIAMERDATYRSVCAVHRCRKVRSLSKDRRRDGVSLGSCTDAACGAVLRPRTAVDAKHWAVFAWSTSSA